MIPGQPTIDHIDVNGSKAGKRVDVSTRLLHRRSQRQRNSGLDDDGRPRSARCTRYQRRTDDG